LLFLKYQSEDEPTFTLFTIPEDVTSPLSPQDDTVLIDDGAENIIPPDEDEFTFVLVSKLKALMKYKFVYNFLQNSFRDKSKIFLR
jgi:hypothetical protein